MNRFDAMAKGFDTDSRKTRAEAVAEALMTRIKVSGKNAIEFGCGTGLVGLSIAQIFSSLVLIDSSEEMIAEAEKKISKEDAGKISALCCDLMEKVPEGLCADYIFSSLVLHHIIDIQKALEIFRSILNVGGHLLVVDLNPDDGGFHAKYADFDGHNGFEQAALIALAEQVGFKNVQSHTFYADVKIVGKEEMPYSLFILDAER